MGIIVLVSLPVAVKMKLKEEGLVGESEADGHTEPTVAKQRDEHWLFVCFLFSLLIPSLFRVGHPCLVHPPGNAQVDWSRGIPPRRF